MNTPKTTDRTGDRRSGRDRRLAARDGAIERRQPGARRTQNVPGSPRRRSTDLP